jgi:hypothetical protein
MFKNKIRIAFSAIILAGAFGLAGATAAHAESVKKICGEQWKAAKAAGTTGGKTWPEFLSQCSAEQKGAATPAAASETAAPAPAAAPAATAAEPEPAAEAATPSKPAKRKSTSGLAAGPGQFAAEAEAKAKCPTDTVVWVNTKTKVFHYASHPSYGKTKKGAYMCEADATTAGARASKNEKKP